MDHTMNATNMHVMSLCNKYYSFQYNIFRKKNVYQLGIVFLWRHGVDASSVSFFDRILWRCKTSIWIRIMIHWIGR